jgi:hypothetical protein
LQAYLQIPLFGAGCDDDDDDDINITPITL